MTSASRSHHFHVQRSKTGTSTLNCLLVANQQSGSHGHSLQIISTTGRMKAEIPGSRLNVRIRHHNSHLKNQSSRETTKSVSPKRCHLSEIKSRHTKKNSPRLDTLVFLVPGRERTGWPLMSGRHHGYADFRLLISDEADFRLLISDEADFRLLISDEADFRRLISDG